jgi:hypothetical protein
MLALRNLLCNDRWEQEWPQIKAHLIAQARHRRFSACQQRLHTTQSQQRSAVIAAQHAQYAALHPQSSPADSLPTATPSSTPKSNKPPPNHPGAAHPSARPDSNKIKKLELHS